MSWVPLLVIYLLSLTTPSYTNTIISTTATTGPNILRMSNSLSSFSNVTDDEPKEDEENGPLIQEGHDQHEALDEHRSHQHLQNGTCPCLAAISCTTSSHFHALHDDYHFHQHLSRDHCVPQTIKDYKIPIICNIIVIIILGTGGNLLTLFALPYAMKYYSQRFPLVCKSTTVLLLNLAFCDLIYCSFGLTVQADIFINGYLGASENFCSWNAWARDMVAYTASFTMAGIALTRCFSIVFKQPVLMKFFKPKMALRCCFLIWVLTFIILSPTFFEVDGFGQFGYDQDHGICEIKQCYEKQKKIDNQWTISPSGWYFLGAMSVPCLIVISSYLVLSLFLTAHTRSLPGTMTSSINITRINVTLLSVCLAYFLFEMPILPLEFGLLDHYYPESTATYSIIVKSWYWWVYASNFLIYVVTTRDFRTIYRLFLGDMATKLGAHNLAAQILPD